MMGYQTQQRSLLISFFESHPDEAFTNRIFHSG
jgi:hypothetical protein